MNRYCVIVILLSILPPLDAQETKRAAVPLRFGDARSLAEVLAKHLKAEPTFQVVAEPTSNTLLLSGAPATLREVMDLLEVLDRAPRQVAIDLWIAEAKSDADFTIKELEGPLPEIRTKLDGWLAKGRLSALRHFELKTSENKAATVSNLGMHHYVAGVSGLPGKGGFGKPAASYVLQVKPVGAKLIVTPRIPPDKDLVLELTLEDSRAFVPDDGAVLGQDDKGLPIRATDSLTSMVEAKVAVGSGRAVAVQGVTSRSKSGAARTIIIVGARTLATP